MPNPEPSTVSSVSGTTRTEGTEAVAYNALTEQVAYDWQVGGKRPLLQVWPAGVAGSQSST